MILPSFHQVERLLARLSICIESRSQGPIVLGQGRCLDFYAKAFLQCMDNAVVLCHPTGHGHVWRNPDAVDKTNDTAGNGTMDTGNDVDFIGSFRQLTDDIQLGKDRAG